MHRLLIERSTVIDALIKAKGTERRHAPFRPQREAEMMRRLAARHEGSLPLTSVEHIWREIISTFTFMQAPFRVVVDFGSDPRAMQDLARFAFGFSVELVAAEDPAEVVALVARSGRDLGLIPRPRGLSAEAWWRGLSATNGPRLMGVLPFLSTTGPAANAPAFVISPALAEPTPPDFQIVAVAVDDIKAIRGSDKVAVLAGAPAESGAELMLAIAGDLGEIAAGVRNLEPIGGIALGGAVVAALHSARGATPAWGVA
jgi:chorismate mutase/prephenate dehydratase